MKMKVIFRTIAAALFGAVLFGTGAFAQLGPISGSGCLLTANCIWSGTQQYNNQEAFNFGFTSQSANGVTEWKANPIFVDSTVGTFNFSHFSSANGFGITRTNEIYSLGYNFSPNFTIPANPNDDSFGEVWETNYAQDATHFLFERHFTVHAKDQTEKRAWSWSIEKWNSANPYRVIHQIDVFNFNVADQSGNIIWQFNTGSSPPQFLLQNAQTYIKNTSTNATEIELILDNQRTGFGSHLEFRHAATIQWDLNHDPNTVDLYVKDLGAGGSGGINFTYRRNGGVSVGATSLATRVGELGLTTTAAAGATAPGAAGEKIGFVCGTNAGTAKLVAYAGTSATAVTIIDNIGAGVTGC